MLGKSAAADKYIARPEVFGPGTWFCMHTMAWHANSYMEQYSVAQQIKIIIDNLPCINPCRENAQKYWAADPATQHCNEVKGVFWWTVRFHNVKNRDLNKPILTDEQVLQLYSGDNICAANCGSHEPKNDNSYVIQVSVPDLEHSDTITPINSFRARITSSPVRTRPAETSKTWWGQLFT